MLRLWSPFRAKLIEEVEKVQKRPTKFFPGLRQLSYTKHLQKLQLPTLVYRRARGDMIEVFKIVHGHYDPECVPHLQPSSYCNTRGHNRKLFKLQSHLDLRKKTLLRSELCLNGIRCLLVWRHRVLMPSKTVLISSDSIKKFASTIKPSSTIEPSSLSCYVRIWIYGLHSLRPEYLLAFAFAC